MMKRPDMSGPRRSSELSHMIDAIEHMRAPFVISICGPAGAGKSQVAKKTAEILGEDLATRIPTDYFFIPRPAGMSLDGFLRTPLKWDWALMLERFEAPVGTELSTPDVDFGAFRRWSEHGGLTFTIRPVIVCDAMAPCPKSDLVILLNVMDEERQRRMIERDVRWSTRVIDRWEHLQTTWRACSPFRADVVIDGTQPVEVSAWELASVVRELWEVGRRYQ